MQKLKKMDWPEGDIYTHGRTIRRIRSVTFVVKTNHLRWFVLVDRIDDSGNLSLITELLA